MPRSATSEATSRMPAIAGTGYKPPVSLTITYDMPMESPHCPVCGFDLAQRLVEEWALSVTRTALTRDERGWHIAEALPDGIRHWYACGGCGQRLPEILALALIDG